MQFLELDDVIENPLSVAAKFTLCAERNERTVGGTGMAAVAFD